MTSYQPTTNLSKTQPQPSLNDVDSIPLSTLEPTTFMASHQPDLKQPNPTFTLLPQLDLPLKLLRLVRLVVMAHTQIPPLIRVILSPLTALPLGLILLIAFLVGKAKINLSKLLFPTRHRLFDLLQHRSRSLNKFNNQLDTTSSDLHSIIHPHLNHPTSSQIDQSQSSTRLIIGHSNYLIRHTKESLSEFSMLLLGQTYSLSMPLKNSTTDEISRYWARRDSPIAKVKSLIRSCRTLLLTKS